MFHGHHLGTDHGHGRVGGRVIVGAHVVAAAVVATGHSLWVGRCVTGSKSSRVVE